MSLVFLYIKPHTAPPKMYWVNLSKRGGKDRVFRGLAGLLRGISRGRSPREIQRTSPASPRKIPSFPTLLLRFRFYFQYISVLALLKCTYGSVLAFLKSTDGSVLALLKSTDCSVLALLRLPLIFSCQDSTVGQFWCTMAIM